MIQLITIIWLYSKGFDLLGYLKNNYTFLYWLNSLSIPLEFIGLGIVIQSLFEVFKL